MLRTWLQAVGLLALLGKSVLGNEIELKQDDANRQSCAGMYSRKSWGGSVDPFILTKFIKPAQEIEGDPLVSMIIFEWKDEHLIGRSPDGTADGDKETICDPENVSKKFCEEKDIGAFILAANASETSLNPIVSMAIHLKEPPAFNYPIRKTGFYCVSTYAYSEVNYRAVVEFRNSYGELPAAQIAKLPFYGGLTITYAVLGAFWAFLYFQNRGDILPVQNYITATIIFLVIEQLMTWGFYDFQNRNGFNAGAKALLVLVAILNAGRNSLSFFLLLIVCMGYGVVKPSLGRTMIYVRGLAIAHFVFGVVYAIASLIVTPETAGPLVLLVILPLAGTLTAFYVWTLNALNHTMKDLIDRKQKVKAMMYKQLWWCILGSIMVIFGFFFINSFMFAGTRDADFVPRNWQTRWFVLDGWLNLVYFFDVMFIAYLWRPTSNNRRFAMSDELGQEDDEGFEIRSKADSQEENDDPEGNPPAYDPERRHNNAINSGTSGVKPSSSPRPRESLDGETIFAVGEGDEEGDDKWSDAEDASPIEDGAEGKRLTGN